MKPTVSLSFWETPLRATADLGTEHFARAVLETLGLVFAAHSHFPLALFSPPSPGFSVCFVVIQRGSAAPTVSPTSKPRFLKRLSGNLNISCVDFPLGQIFVQEDDFKLEPGLICLKWGRYN